MSDINELIFTLVKISNGYLIGYLHPLSNLPYNVFVADKCAIINKINDILGDWE